METRGVRQGFSDLQIRDCSQQKFVRISEIRVKALPTCAADAQPVAGKFVLRNAPGKATFVSACPMV